MFVHDAQNIQFVGVAHNMGGCGRKFRQALGNAKRLCSATAANTALRTRGASSLRRFFLLEDAHPHLAVIARRFVLEGVKPQILFKPVHIMIQRSKQADTPLHRRKILAGSHAPGILQLLPCYAVFSGAWAPHRHGDWPTPPHTCWPHIPQTIFHARLISHAFTKTIRFHDFYTPSRNARQCAGAARLSTA